METTVFAHFWFFFFFLRQTPKLNQRQVLTTWIHPCSSARGQLRMILLPLSHDMKKSGQVPVFPARRLLRASPRARPARAPRRGLVGPSQSALRPGSPGDWLAPCPARRLSAGGRVAAEQGFARFRAGPPSLQLCETPGRRVLGARVLPSRACCLVRSGTARGSKAVQAEPRSARGSALSSEPEGLRSTNHKRPTRHPLSFGQSDRFLASLPRLLYKGLPTPVPACQPLQPLPVGCSLI